VCPNFLSGYTIPWVGKLTEEKTSTRLQDGGFGSHFILKIEFSNFILMT
jgi:hypothetical protein